MAFTTPEESYKPTVIFFGLTNLLATFQAIINDILRDLVDTNSIANFIEIAIDLEGHDDIVKEVIKRMVENDLYIYIQREMPVER